MIENKSNENENESDNEESLPIKKVDFEVENEIQNEENKFEELDKIL